MEQWEMMTKMVKEFYLAFKQEEFLNKGMTEERERAFKRFTAYGRENGVYESRNRK